MAVTFWEILHKGATPFYEEWAKGHRIDKIFDGITDGEVTLTLPNDAPEHIKGLVKMCVQIFDDGRVNRI